MALESGKVPVWLAKFEPLKIDNVGGDEARELWIATHDLNVVFGRPGDPPSGTIPGLLTEPHDLSISALDGSSLISTRSLPAFGNPTFGNPDGRFDEVLGWTWKRRKVTVWQGFLGETLWRDDPVWSALCEEPRWERYEITVPTIGIEDLLEQPFQPNVYTPGYEPYWIGDGLDNIIDFTSVLNRGTGGFTIGIAFRTTTAGVQFLYGRKTSTTGSSAGYSLGLGAATVRFDVSDGANVAVTFVPPGGYADGARHTLVGQRDPGTGELRLYYDGALVQTVAEGALGSLANALSLTAGASGGVATRHLDGEIERVAQILGGSAANADLMISALDERFADDADASGFNHYVPLTENIGNTAGDLSASGFDGTFSGEASDDAYWSGLRNGTRELDGVRKPIGFGSVQHARPILIDPIKGVYQYHDTSADSSIPGISQVTDRGQNVGSGGSVSDIWTDAGLVTPGSFISDASAGLIRIIPAGTSESIVPTIVFQNGAFEEIEDAIAYVATMHGFETSLDPLNIPDYAFQNYWRDEVTIGEVLDTITRSMHGLWSTDSRNPYGAVSGDPKFRFLSVHDPAGDAPDFTIKIDPDLIAEGDILVSEDGLRRIGIAPQYKSVTVEHQRYQGFFSQGEILPFVDHSTTNIDFPGLTSEYRRATVKASQAPLGRFPGADDVTFTTVIGGHQTLATRDAATEAQRLLDLYGQIVEVWEVDLGEYEFQGWLGDIVEVEGPIDSFESGRNFIVVGASDDADEGGSVLTLWGPRPGTALPALGKGLAEASA